MSGHSKWANIKHKKGKADADKSNAFEVRALKKDAEYQKQLLEDNV